MSDPTTEHIDVAYVARLARLELTEQEQQETAAQLDQVLAFMHQLDDVDVEGVEPMAHAVPRSNVFREDEPRECLDRDEVLNNAPAQVQKLIRVPNILD